MIRRPIVSSLSILACLFLAVSPQSAAIPLPAQSAGVQLIGTVVDGALSPLAGVAITLTRQGAVIARTTSDKAGRFRFERVAPGDYEVKATHANAPALVRAVRIGAGAKVVNLPLVMASPLKQAEGASVGQSAAMPVAAPTPPATASAAAPIGQVGLATRAAGGRGGGALDQFQSQSVTESVYWPYPESRDRYDGVEPNRFKNTLEHPLSTFGADVDTASFVNVRRFLSNGQLPPTDAVRVEDFLNYFKPDYAQPRGGQPLALTAEIGDCP